MKTIRISSVDNRLIKLIKAMQAGGVKANRARASTGLALLEGIHLTQTWAGDSQLKSLITTEEGLGHPEIAALIERLESSSGPVKSPSGHRASDRPRLYVLDEKLWPFINELGNTAPLLSMIELSPKCELVELIDDVVILDAIQDAGNVGTMLRSAAAAGFRQVVCTTGTAQLWSTKVLRAGMGAHKHLRLWEGISVDQLLKLVKVPLFATSSHATNDLFDLGARLRQPHAWVFGNEGSGVSHKLLDVAETVAIPQNPQVESLNVAAAAAVCLFETVRIRRI